MARHPCRPFREGKIIKNLRKIAFRGGIAVAVLSVILLLIVFSGATQNAILQQWRPRLSALLGSDVTYGHIRVARHGRVLIDDLCVRDYRNDTLLYVRHAVVRPRLAGLRQKQLVIQKILLQEADVQFRLDSVLNLTPLVRRFSRTDDDPDRERTKLKFNDIEFIDSQFSYQAVSRQPDGEPGLDFSDIRLKNLQLHVIDLTPGDTGGVSFHIDRLTASDHSGFGINQLQADMSVSGQHMALSNWRLDLGTSRLRGDTVSFAFGSYHDFTDGRFRDHVLMRVGLHPGSTVLLHELGYFVSYFLPESSTVQVSGTVSGMLEDLDVRALQLQKNDDTQIQADLRLLGLPEWRTTRIKGDFKTLSVGMNDLKQIRTNSETGTVVLPESMDAFTRIAYSGTFDGEARDFEARGLFTSNLGDMQTDVRISLPENRGNNRDTSFLFRGEVDVMKLDLGALVLQPSLGTVSLKGKADGHVSPKGDLFSTIEGNVSELYWKQYPYRDLAVNGHINNKVYDGFLKVDEPHIGLEFSGMVDLTRRTPHLALDAKVSRADLYALHLTESDTSAFASFKATCDVTGNNIDDVEGEFNVSDLTYTHCSRQVHMDDLLLFTKTISDTKRFILRSDILNAELWGQYQFMALPDAFMMIVQELMPSLVKRKIRGNKLSTNNFEYEIELKDSDRVTALYADDFHISRATTLKGVFNPQAHDIAVICDLPAARFNGRSLRNFMLTCRTDSARMYADADCDELFLSQKLRFDHLSLRTEWCNDSIAASAVWDDGVETGGNRGVVHGQAVAAMQPSGIRRWTFSLPEALEQQFTYNGETFRLACDEAVLDGRKWDISRLIVGNETQRISADGVISESENDVLMLQASGMDLSFFSQIAAVNRLDFAGILDGTLSLASLQSLPQVVSDFTVKDFAINDQYIGDLDATSEWQRDTRLLQTEVSASRDSLRVISARGTFQPDDRLLDFNVLLTDIPLKSFHPYLQAVFSEVTGTVGGRMHVGGTLSVPVLDGMLDLSQAGCTVDFTRTSYNFKNSVPVENNTMIFRNTGITDVYSHTATINGTLSFTTWTDILFDLGLETRNLEVLNTTINDNSVFYGHACAAGRLDVKGSLRGIAMNINMTNTDNTSVILPLELGNDVSRSNFISFVNPAAVNTDRRTTRRRRQTTDADAAGEQSSPSTFELDMTLNVTPQAEIQMVFDSTIGDILRGNGSGTLRMNLDKESNFTMFGTYTIEKGDYLFTLQNVINKKFTIEEGGTVSFSGDPVNAFMNVRALYKARPSLYDLTGDESLRRRADVNCIIKISNTLLSPNIAFEIDIPNADQEIKSYLSSATALEDDMTRQFLSLLVMNSFYTDQGNLAGNQSSTTNGLESMGLTTATEFLSSQLSRMISGLSKNVDFGVSYRPSVETGSQDVAFNVSTDVISLSGNVDVGNNKTDGTANDNILNDFSMEVRLNRRGTLLFKAFNRANSSYLFEQADYTQGIGLLYREDFNSFDNLSLFRKKYISPLAAIDFINPTNHE